LNFVQIIANKRDGRQNTEDELRFLALGAADGSIPDYQLSAWLMAAYLNPLDADETAWLTRGMADSGTRIDLNGLPKPWVDKHSTGGVGDKTTLVLLPILAACGLTVVKMSGRGLGITGGTIDKLSAIPGFRLDLTPEEMKTQAARIGLALTGQSPNLAPADKALYALRDVTATVASIPLIVSSILSKKIAGGADTIVLDVKCGSGAFMPSLDKATALAKGLSETGSRLGLGVKVSISDMSQPLGAMVGNALEVGEAMSVLQGRDLTGPALRFRELCLYYAGETLEASGKATSVTTGKAIATEVLESGQAFEKFKEWVTAQGGTPIWQEDSLPQAKATVKVSYPGHSAYVKTVDALTIGQAIIELGGGRKSKEDEVDLSVGIEIHVSVGDQVTQGALLCTVHAADRDTSHRIGEKLLYDAFGFSATAVEPPPLILRSY
jgi:pyrimidine-nucleoside phosphorylase